jgi:bifunctional non-homologous end joining protein LigD
MAIKTKKPKGEPEAAEAPPGEGGRLAAYEAKRDFQITPEPAPTRARKESDAPAPRSSQAEGLPEKKTAAPLAFVVQKHDARRLHYDVRLEIDGAMASWAVPRGPSYDPKVKRLAVQTEDHPMEYNLFEGRIPNGEYGAGDVLIWDRGTYETVPPGQQRAMLDKGHLHVRLAGEKLVGDWHLIKTSGRAGGPKDLDGTSAALPRRGQNLDDGAGGTGKAQWLFFKAQDARASPTYDVVTERPESVVSGMVATRGPQRVGASERGKSARALKEAVGEPMLAQAAAPDGTSPALPGRGRNLSLDPKQWLFEVKYDGYRVIACKAGPDVRLYTRRSNDWTDRFRPIADAIARLPARECAIDGEACAVDDGGRPSFQALQQWLAGETQHARIGYVAFDLLWLDGRDLRGEPIESRRELLEKLLQGVTAPLSFSRTAAGAVDDLLAAAKMAGLEGLMAKRKGSPYSGGRSAYWMKIRLDKRQDCAVVGYVPMAGSESDVGALVLAVSEGGKLVYAGKVGTGFDARTRRVLAERLDKDRVESTKTKDVPKMKDARWVDPKLVCECAFSEWTGDGSMRQPRYLGLREDKAPLECYREDSEREPPEEPVSKSQAPFSAGGSPKLTNPTKVLFPRDGYTKRDIWDYYTAIAPVILPQIAGRPLTMQRYPDGIDGEEWYQQNVPLKTPAFVRLVDSGPRHDHKARIVCDDLITLQWLANLAALTLHQWCSHVPPTATTRAAIDHALALPDYFVIDLDPGDGPWDHVIQVALALKTLFDALSLASFVKTSGKRGLHVLVPFAPGPTHGQATGFAEQVARAVAKVLPSIATVERMKEKRGGKLYVDYGQNGEGRTIVAPYTIRARDGAVVSTPISWDEVNNELDPTRYTIKTVPERVKEKGDLMAGVIEGQASRQRLPI